MKKYDHFVLLGVSVQLFCVPLSIDHIWFGYALDRRSKYSKGNKAARFLKRRSMDILGLITQ